MTTAAVVTGPARRRTGWEGRAAACETETIDPAPTIAASLDAARDRRLVADLRAGNEVALREIYSSHAAAVHGVSMRICRSRSVADDVTQNVMLELWRRPERYDPERGTLRTYLVTLARARTLDLLRSETSRERRERADGEQPTPPPTTVEDRVVDLQVGDAVRAALAALTDDERQAIERAYFGGRTYREVASELDTPEGTVKSRIRSGLVKLRQRLEAAGVVWP